MDDVAGGPLPVSVVIPTYNRAERTRRAVESALAQRPHPPSEVIVVDDGSTDNTGTAAEAAGARVIRHERNMGEGAARNTGIANATQPWIGLLDSDDEWLPHLLATLWPLRSDHVLVAGSALYHRPQKVSYAGLVGRRTRTIRSPASLFYPGCLVPASGVLLRADAVRAAGWFPEGWLMGSDLDLWLRMLERGTGVMSPVPVVDYHVHPGQASADRRAHLQATLRILRAYQDRPWWSRTRLEAWRGVAAWDTVRLQMSEGNHRGATRTAAGAARSPVRLAGLTGIVLRRLWMRRRAAQVGAASTGLAQRLHDPVLQRQHLPVVGLVVVPAEVEDAVDDRLGHVGGVLAADHYVA